MRTEKTARSGLGTLGKVSTPLYPSLSRERLPTGLTSTILGPESKDWSPGREGVPSPSPHSGLPLSQIDVLMRRERTVPTVTSGPGVRNSEERPETSPRPPESLGNRLKRDHLDELCVLKARSFTETVSCFTNDSVAHRVFGPLGYTTRSSLLTL